MSKLNLLLFILLLIVVVKGKPTTTSINENNNNNNNNNNELRDKPGVFSLLIKYLDYAMDFIFKSIFGIKSIMDPSDDDDDDYDDAVEVNYKGFQLLRIFPKNHEEAEEIQELEYEPNVHLWIPPTKNYSADVILPPDIAVNIKQELKKRKIDFRVLNTNIQRAIQNQNPKGFANGNEKSNRKKETKDPPFAWDRYHTFEEILQYLNYLEEKYKNIAELITIGKTNEGRDLKVIRISDGQMEQGILKPAVWIDGGMHAREWISISTALYLIRELVENDKNKKLVQNIDWYILPVANPDGYAYTHTVDRLWRKSRNSINPARYFWEGSLCKGVDLNRNWNYRWMADGGSDNRCAENYAGSSAFSEPETKAMSRFIMDNRDRLILYLTLHSYAQMWLMPWSHAKSKSDDYDDLLYVAKKAVESIKKVHGTEYELGTALNPMYPASGTSDDWAKSKAGIKYSYTVELGDKGAYGFLLPASYIIPTGKEIFTAVQAMANSIVTSPIDKYNYTDF